jgi:hypothetical protein
MGRDAAVDGTEMRNVGDRRDGMGRRKVACRPSRVNAARHPAYRGGGQASSFACGQTDDYGENHGSEARRSAMAMEQAWEMQMPTVLLILGILAGRLVLAIARGAMYVLLLPARTALAIAPHVARPRWVLVCGATASIALVTCAVLLLRDMR